MVEPSFKAWCVENGVRILGIDAAYVAEGWRGVVATKDIQPGEVILRVPERLLLTAHTAHADPLIHQALQRTGASLSSQQLLGVHVIHEVCRGPDSFWHVYLQQLPRSYTTLCNFTPADIQQLQLGFACDTASSAVQAAMTDWQQARPVLASLGAPSKWQSRQAWMWVASTLMSRTMFLQSDPAGALTPFGDLHNYEAPPPAFLPDVFKGLQEGGEGAQGDRGLGANGAAADDRGGEEGGGTICGDGHFDLETREYHIVARRRYSMGDQVFLCYGQHTNLELLEHYGFILPQNPHDTAPLPPHLFTQLLPQCSTTAPTAASCYIHLNGCPSWDLLVWLRRAAASPSELRDRGHLLLEGKPLSREGDLQVLRWLHQACQLQLQSLPTSAEADEQLLKQLEALGSCQERAALAVHWRLCYKRILLLCLRRCCRALQVQHW